MIIILVSNPACLIFPIPKFIPSRSRATYQRACGWDSMVVRGVPRRIVAIRVGGAWEQVGLLGGDAIRCLPGLWGCGGGLVHGTLARVK
jgi:hypothetical protein